MFESLPNDLYQCVDSSICSGITSSFGVTFPISIHLAGQPQYTLNLERGSRDNGTRILLWPHSKGDCDLWHVEPFDALNR